MVPDDLIKPEHLSSAISQLTPEQRPDALTDEVWDLIENCADENPDFDAVEIHECLTEGECSEQIENSELITLPMVLFILEPQEDPSSAARPQGRNHR